MTEREFFEKLAKVKVEWHLTSSGQVRTNLKLKDGKYVLCPILALANHIAKEDRFLYGHDDWQPAVDFLGLSKYSNYRITEAEDNANDQDMNVRKKLLKACKLVDPKVNKIAKENINVPANGCSSNKEVHAS